MSRALVQTGLDSLVATRFKKFEGQRIGVLANQAACDASLNHLVDLLLDTGTIQIERVFAPEHGFRGEHQDMVEVENAVDPKTKLKVTSIYGKKSESLAPKKGDLRGLDCLVVDLPDIGTRYYTFAQSLGYSMQVCGALGIKVVVLDRPNPIGGNAFEGAFLEPECRSFCGFSPVLNRHGLTLGELAMLMKRGFGKGSAALSPIDCELEIVPIKNWQRKQYFPDTQLPWIIPSPNMPTTDTALVYPGACLFECTNISEGRGTTKPFELLGAPFIDGFAWAKETFRRGVELQGVLLRPTSFIPKFQKWKDKACNGVQIHVTDRETFKPFRLALAQISALKALYPEEFKWRKEAYEFIDNVPAIDLLFGSALFRECIDSTNDLTGVMEHLTQAESWYGSAREEFLLYATTEKRKVR